MSDKIHIAMPARTSPGQTRSALPVGEPVHGGDKWASGSKRMKWTRTDNTTLMQCYFKSKPQEWGYMGRMRGLWMEMRPELPLTAKQLVAQRSNIVRKQLLSELEVEEIKQQVGYLHSTTEEHRVSEHQLETHNSAACDQVYTNPDTLNERAKELRNKIISKQVASSCHNNRVSLKKISKAIPNKLLEDINLALETIKTTSITETNTLIYSAATITLEEMGVKALPARHQASSPPWRIRLERNIKSLRAKISKLSHQMANSPKHPKRNATKEALESAKQRLVGLSARLKRYTKEQESKRVNTLFTHNPSRVYSMLKGEEKKPMPDPPAPSTAKFWKDIWEDQSTHNTQADWLRRLKDSHQGIVAQPEIIITEGDIGRRVQRMKNWAAPGPDMIQAFWLKKLTSLHARMAQQMECLISQGEHPEWLTKGRTVLVMKDPSQGPIPKNYRPITCLSTTWKLLSGVIAGKLEEHMGTHMSSAQKGIGRNTRGAKHQLLVDLTVSQDSRKRHTNLAMAWIDYKKAYDSVPHSWILECLRLYNVNPKLLAFIKMSMNHWRTELEANGKKIASVNIQRGIYQGDALSPLLFCICLNPLSSLLRDTKYGYQFKSGTTINHLFYMDDIKLYAKKERDIDSLIHLTRVFSNDIGMTFGIEKCGRLILNRGRMVKTNGLQLPTGTIKDVEEGYKYLGIMQSDTNHDSEARTRAIAEYKKRVRQVLRSRLNARNQVRAINAYAVPVIRYPAGIIKWTEESITEADITSRKLLTIHGAFNPKSNTARLYLSRKEGGRGIVSVKQAVREEEQSIRAYIASMACIDKVIAESHSIITSEEPPTDDLPQWQSMPLHGAYHRRISEVGDVHQTYGWLHKGDLAASTEALILAAQEQVLPTRQRQTQIYKTRTDSRCRLCKDQPETIQHIISGCRLLAGTAYTERHNHVAGVVYRGLCAEYGLSQPKNWWEVPDKVNENNHVKILWDFYIHTDKHVLANQPDIVVVDKGNKRATIIDIAVPSDYNIASKEKEKVEKYQPLREEIEKCWKVKTTVVPIVIGALGAVTPAHQMWLAQLPSVPDSYQLQKSALLGTAKILRRVLKLPGLW